MRLSWVERGGRGAEGNSTALGSRLSPQSSKAAGAALGRPVGLASPQEWDLPWEAERGWCPCIPPPVWLRPPCASSRRRSGQVSEHVFSREHSRMGEVCVVWRRKDVVPGSRAGAAWLVRARRSVAARPEVCVPRRVLLSPSPCLPSYFLSASRGL